jgi:16S rRNA (guanine527-N7)-methyltransferase
VSAAGSALPFPELIRVLSLEQGISLSESQLRMLEIHRELLETWGRKMNLTSIRDAEEIARRHFLEGLMAGRLLERHGAGGVLLDLGSGNGFPAIPIRISLPDAFPLILVESSSKRAAFLRAVLREVGWSDSRVEVRRAERGADLLDIGCDIFTTRGVAPFRFLREGLPFLHSGGSALLFIRRDTLLQAIPQLPASLRLVAEEPLPGREAGMILLKKI